MQIETEVAYYGSGRFAFRHPCTMKTRMSFGLV